MRASYCAGRLLALLAAVLIAAPMAATGAQNEPANGSAGRPNVVFILTDDQRGDTLGVAGHPHLKTPHLDELAGEGVRFANAFATTSLCSPSRASFLSGLYAHRHGVINNFTDFPAALPSFPRRLHEGGYRTAYIGKWHMGEDDDSPRAGYDFWASHKGQGNYVDNEFNVNGQRQQIPGYYTTAVTDLAVDFIDRESQGEKPFCLILGHKAPHTPYTPEPKYAKEFDGLTFSYPESAFHLDGKPEWVVQRLDTWHGIYGPLYGFREKFPDRSQAAEADFDRFVKAYLATIRSIDDSVGRVVQALTRAGVVDETLIIFAGDNGMFLGEHGMTDKRTMHEDSIRIPLIMRYPARAKAGTVAQGLALNIDVAPTVLEICGASLLEGIDGRSLVPLLEGHDEGWRTSFLYEYNYEEQFPYTPNVRGVRTDKWKYVHYPHGDGGPDRHKAELYDLKADPGELHNRIDDPEAATVLSRLQNELERLQRETAALPDQMPIDQGIKSSLPDAKIR